MAQLKAQSNADSDRSIPEQTDHWVLLDMALRGRDRTTLLELKVITGCNLRTWGEKMVQLEPQGDILTWK